ncbi:type III-B CRISPR-associated protein Cas10/Cmr2 [Polyangium mundeleinium]|uniref:Type III-B CRISPR-associated protein Cas10/Cmr2 n=1 Tax=Polyangium mundeleinium TaxID=2995306 RepID=A0ABT5EI41_9BACT|nr:type III-B CRISPR-associated protein Cas10/Cmr2 [Polyangium mundeleinium]MDC0741482.1 type III-B CRISPR-associated protein Cas10/Cmr2 [Polyangium mundeleinium]
MPHLLLVHIGPVQAFIAQARRTRDLWFGSHLLVELSRAAARALASIPGTKLIFPALDEKGELTGDIANKILAEVEQDPKTAAEAARTAVNKALRARWETLREKLSALLDPAAREAADEQIDTLVEFFAAYVPLSEDDYRGARERVEEELAARKTLRDFVPFERQRGGAHKSSLDGARETVLVGGEPRKETRKHPLFQQYRIGLREELDAIGLLKRAGGEPGQFVPLPTIGLAAYTTRARQTPQCQEPMRKLLEACRRLGFPQVRSKGRPWVEPFPFDAQIFLPDRWEPYFDDLGIPESPRAFGKQYIEPLHDLLGEPHPYVACLVADGDRMGAAIDSLESAEAHQRFSRKLSRLPEIAREIVERDHHGVVVYAGGDDVLAFVTIPDALACAKALREQFIALMDESLPGAAPRPTLSVGIGLGHVLESLGDLLALGREAEQAAKVERDSLALLVEMHTGARKAYIARFDADPLSILQKDIATLATLPMKKVHQVAAMLRRLPHREERLDDAAHWARLLRLDTSATLARSELGAGAAAPDPAALGLDLEGDDYARMHVAIEAWCGRMEVAAFLARAEPSVKKGEAR